MGEGVPGNYCMCMHVISRNVGENSNPLYIDYALLHSSCAVCTHRDYLGTKCCP